jgi:hypothetical protein
MAPEGFDEIKTLTGNSGFTAMVMAFEVAGLLVGQMALDVKTQVMISPFAREASVKVVEDVPALTPFFFH